MNLLKFFKKFPYESSCVEGFKNKGLEMKIVCKRCQHTKYSFRKTYLKFQYKKCGGTLSLRSGTVTENSNFPFQYWMISIELMTLSKKVFQHEKCNECWGINTTSLFGL